MIRTYGSLPKWDLRMVDVNRVNFDDGLEVRPVRPEEVEAVELVINKSFSKDPANPSRQNFFTRFDYIPRQRAELFWGAFYGDTPVGGLLLIPYHIMIWYCPLHLVAMTGVGVLHDYRHKGIAARMIEVIHSKMSWEGFDGVVLHSAADLLYEKMGYQTAFCEIVYQIPWTYAAQSMLRSLEEKKVASGAYVEFFIESELTDTVSEELFWVRHQSTQFVKRSIRNIRDPLYYHLRLRQHLHEGANLAVIYSGRDIRAFALARYEMNVLTIYEQYSLLNDSNDFVMLWGALLEEYDSPHLTLEMKTYATDTAVLALAKKFQGTVLKNLFTKNMAILFDPGFILPWMQTTFCQRVANSPFRDLQEEFLMQIEEKTFYFRITREIVSLYEITEKTAAFRHFDTMAKFVLTKKQWVALTFGYNSVYDLCEDIVPVGREKACEPYEKILAVLYPELDPVWDYFEKL